MKRLQPFWLALVLLTTLPVGGLIRTPVTAADQGRSVACYPLVGLLVGGLLALAATLLMGADAPLAAALLLVVWVGLNGALHLDGLADCTDAWFAGHDDATRSLQVMKDPAAGPMAVTAVVLLLLVKFGALLSLWPGAAWILVVAPVLGRSAAVGLMLTTPYRRSAGLASAQDAHLPRAAATAGVVLLLAGAGFLLSVGVWLSCLLWVALVTLGWRHLWQRRIGGYTGDVAGALIELVETGVLVICALAMSWH